MPHHNKSWRDEIVLTSNQALNFIECYFYRLTGIHQEDGYKVKPTKTNTPEELSITIGADFRDPYLSFMMHKNDACRGTILYAMEIAGVRGKGLGLLLSKAALAVAYEAELDAITLDSVTDDGVSFHPMKLGALPFTAPTNLAEISSKMQEMYKADISQHDHTRIKTIRTISETSPYLGFRLISQTGIKLPHHRRGYFIGAVVTEWLSNGYDKYNRDFIVIPGEASTRKILGCLGQLPPYRPLSTNHPQYGHIIRELTPYETVVKELKL